MIKRLICVLLTLILIFSYIPINATKSIESPELNFDKIFEETTTNELYLYNVLDTAYLMNQNYILTNSNFINIIHNIEILYETNHTDRITRLIQRLRTELDIPFVATENLTMETIGIVLYYYTEELGLEIRCETSELLGFDNSAQLSDTAYMPYIWCLENEIFTSMQWQMMIPNEQTDFINLSLNTTKNWVTSDKLHLLDLNKTVTVSEIEPILIKYLEYLANTKTPMESVVEYGRQFLGVDYIYGGSSPRGFDCSGFVHYVFI